MSDGERIVAADPLARPGEEPARAVWQRRDCVWRSLDELNKIYNSFGRLRPLDYIRILPNNLDIASVTREIARGG